MLSNIGLTIIIIVPVYAHMLFVLSFDMTVSKKYVWCFHSCGCKWCGTEVWMMVFAVTSNFVTLSAIGDYSW